MMMSDHHHQQTSSSSSSSPCCHTSVEVTVSPVGMKVTMSSPPTSVSSATPLVITSLVDGDDHCCDNNNNNDEEKPSLVAIGSASDSEQSFDGDDEEDVVRHTMSESNIVTVQSNIVEATQDSSSGYCLSDGFTSFLCPFDQPLDDQHTAPLSRVPSSTQVRKETTSTAAAVTCTEFQLDEILKAASMPGTEMLASLQSWLAMNPNHSSLLKSKRRGFRNRSNTPKSRDSHIHKLYSQWHSTNQIPMNRTKSSINSIPSILSSDSSGELCYDSDPGSGSKVRGVDALSAFKLKKARRQSFKNRYHRRDSDNNMGSYKDKRPVAIDTSLPETPYGEVPPTPRNAFNKVHPPTPRHSDTASSRNNFFGEGSPRSVTDIDTVLPNSELEQKLFFQEIVNSKMNLVWHRCDRSKGKGAKHIPPVSVSAWFELGAHLDHSVVQPKFVWSPTYESNLSKRRVQISGGAPYMLELLSIIRVVAPRKIDRTKYPFARLDRTICVSTNEDNLFVFETPTAEERDILVSAMKMLVARLASIIIVRDEAMLMEFFSPFAGLQSLLDDDVAAEEAYEEQPLPTSTAEQDSAEFHQQQNQSNFLFVQTDEGRARLWGTSRK